MSAIRIDPLTGHRTVVAAAAAPLVTPAAVTPDPTATPDLLSALPARGAHEVLPHAPDDPRPLAALPVEAVVRAVDVWRERMAAHAAAASVHLWADEAGAADAPAGPAHAQLVALDFVPALVARERERFGAYASRHMGANLLGDLVQTEVRLRERLVAYDDEAVVLASYAPRGPYALTLVPRVPRARFEDDGPTGAALLHDVLGRLARRFDGAPAVSLWVRTAPRGAEHFCWHVDVLPRLGAADGLALGAGLDVTAVAPETVAAELRGA